MTAGGEGMSCSICAKEYDISDLSAPYVIRTCATCGREIKIRELEKGGRGIKVTAGDQLVIPPGFIQIALNPLRGTGQLTRSGASWFASQVFVGDYGSQLTNMASAIAAERAEYEPVIKTAPFLSGMDFADDAQANAILSKLKENEAKPAFWAFWADCLLATVGDAVSENDAQKATWAMAYAQRCRAMYVFKEHFEEVAWMGHSAKRLVRLVQIWDANKDNDSEEFWQTTLQEYSFAFSQLFSVPVTLIEGKAYVGGMSLDRRDAKFADFILAGGSASNAILVEIKTPNTKLLSRKYRSVYAPSRDLSGAIVQVEDYKMSLIRELDALNRKGKQPLSVFKPRCVIILGFYQRELDSQSKIDSFEHFRSSMSGVEVITFDEFFSKVEYLLQVFSLVRTGTAGS
jgi:hypothetical protein